MSSTKVTASMRGVVDSQGMWIDKFGNKHNIKTMADDYIHNCVAWLERRCVSFKRAIEDSTDGFCYGLDDQLEAMEKSIDKFVSELNRRAKIGIFIDREIDITPENYGVENAH